ncbi:hypothetical protein D3C81_2077850 [compost metagenome]
MRIKPGMMMVIICMRLLQMVLHGHLLDALRHIDDVKVRIDALKPCKPVFFKRHTYRQVERGFFDRFELARFGCVGSR